MVAEKKIDEKLTELIGFLANKEGMSAEGFIDKILDENKVMLFDIDVKGAYSIRNQYPKESILIFLKPPSIEVLEQRLRNRKTESEEQIRTRIARSKLEIEMSFDFDYIVENDNLQETLDKVYQIIKENIKQ
jgi:guanylate kinase